MSSHKVIKAFKPTDEKWRKMKEAWDACLAAGVSPPRSVEDFFEGETPDGEGVEVSIKTLMGLGAVKEWGADMCDGYEVDVTKLPPEVKVLRFYISY